MNIAEYPIQILTKTVPESTKTIEWHGKVTTKDGRIRDAHWIVTGSDKYGLPRYEDRDVLLAIMYFWYLQGFQSNKLEIRDIHSVLKLLGWGKSSKDYRRLMESLGRLAGIMIHARFSFWDNKEKDYKPEIFFHILNKVELKKDSLNKRGYILYIEAGEEFWESIKNNYIKSLNISFYFGLETPTAKALYTFLDKKAYQNETFYIELYNLASKIGISTSQPKKYIKRLLKEASDILTNKRFLEYYEFKKINSSEVIIFHFNKEYLSKEEREIAQKQEEYVRLIIKDIFKVVGDQKSIAFYDRVARNVPQDLIYRVLSEVRDAELNGEIKTTKTRLFAYLIRKYMKELYGIKI